MEFKNPYYQLYISNSSCIFDIRVNDMYAIYFNYPGTVAFDQPVNHLLLKSGKQKLTIRMLPVAGEHFLNERSKLELKVQVMEANGDFSVRQEIASYTTDPVTTKNIPAIEHHMEFEAKIPYTLKGWEQSVSLKDMPALKEQLFAWYKMMHRLVAAKDFTTFEKLNLKAYQEDSIGMYNPAFMQEHLPEVFSYITNPDFNLLPLDMDALQVHHYGDGKVVCLRWPDHKPAIYLEYPKDKEQYTLDFFLHKPTAGSDFEIIR
jgi:hypothetical protein